MNQTIEATEQTRKVIAAVEGGTLAFTDLLRTVAHSDTAANATVIDLPKTVAVSATQESALEWLRSEVANTVTPTERRALTADELVALMTERGMLDEVAKLIEDRKEAQRAAIFNHFDVEAEAAGQVDAERDKKGHYIAKAEVVVAGSGKKFTREIRTASPTLTADDLAAMVDDPTVDFTHDDFLACTTQVRVLDEAKVMLHIRKRAGIISALAKATKQGSSTASLYARKG